MKNILLHIHPLYGHPLSDFVYIISRAITANDREMPVSHLIIN